MSFALVHFYLGTFAAAFVLAFIAIHILRLVVGVERESTDLRRDVALAVGIACILQVVLWNV